MSDISDKLAQLSPEKLKQLAQLLDKSGHKKAASAPLRLSSTQQRLWFLEQLGNYNTVYNHSVGVRLVGKFDPTAVEQALGQLVSRHEALLMRFPAIDGQPRLALIPLAEFKWPALTPADMTKATPQELTDRMAESEAVPFDLQNGPVVRAALYQTGPAEGILQLVSHHIVADAASLKVLADELAAIYAGSSTLPAAPAWNTYQNDQPQEAASAELAYWQTQLDYLPAITELPLDLPRPLSFTYRAADIGQKLSVNTWEQLQAVAAGLKVEPAALLLTTLKTLLFRYTGQTDLVIGYENTRRTPATKGLVGPLADPLVLRDQVGNGLTFERLAVQVQETLTAARQHIGISHAQLLQNLNPARDLSRNPLFQVYFVYDQTLDPADRLMPPPIRSTLFDLELRVENIDDNQPRLHLIYNPDLFEAKTAENFLEHFQHLLESALVAPRTLLGQLNTMSEAERRQLLDWAVAVAPFPHDRTVAALFEEQVAQHPAKDALITPDGTISYKELNERANRLAHYLREQGVGPEVRVALSLERSAQVIVSLIAILKAGGIYVPIDAAYPPERLTYMLSDTNPTLLLTQTRLADKLASYGTKLVILDAPEIVTQLASLSTSNLPLTTTPDNTAFILYTSGSTGRPKGILIPQHGVVRLVCGTQSVNLGADETWTQLAPLPFDASTLEIWGTMLNGARLIIPPPGQVGLDEIATLLERYHVTTAWMTAGLFHLMADHYPEQLKRVKQVMSGGDALSPAHVARLLEGEHACRVVNAYGPTENSTFSATYTLDRVEQIKTSVPIGRPVSNSSTYVLNGQQEMAAIGMRGELYVGGPGLAHGYLNQPGLTAEKFVPNSFATTPGDRLYRTGDLVRWLPDGTLEFLGRIDQQVKIRGFRIEPGEIEGVLRQHPALKDVAVIVRQDQPGDKRVVAYLVPDAEDTDIDWRAYARDRLPEYMVPSAFMILPRLPLTPNEKLDRRALPKPEADSAGSYIAPVTHTEKALANLWKAVLNVERVGREDNFFELGGHSLLAAKLVARVRETFKTELNLHELFAAPTVSGLATVIERLEQADGSLEPPPLQPVPRTSDLDVPLSFTQKRLWFVDQLTPGSAAYHIPRAIKITGRLDIPTLERSLKEVVRRHESLRTTFASNDGKLCQVILPFEEWENGPGQRLFSTLDLAYLPAADREEEAMRLARQFIRTALDIKTGPLLQIKLVRLDDEDFVLLITMHHIISDGWSMGLIIREMTTLYRAFRLNEPSPLSPLPIQYPDYAIWQNNWLQGAALDEQVSYWRKQLAGVPPVLELPTDFPRLPEPSHRGAEEQIVFTPAFARQLIAFNQQVGATTFMTLLAAFKVLLHHYTGQTDMVVGAPMANRNRIETEGLIGFFTNSLILRTNLSGDPTFSQVLERVRETSLGAFAYQDFPIEHFLTELRPTRDLSHTPIYQVMFALQNTPLWSEAVKIDQIEVTQLKLFRQMSKFDLELYFVEGQQGELRATVIYSTDLFKQATMQRFLEHLQTILESVVKNPLLTLSQIPLLAEAERRQVVQTWNTTSTNYPAQKSATQLFEAQAERQPDAPALIFRDEQLTYAALNRRANQLAHYLIKQGVGPEITVGLGLDRSPVMIVAMLAVLKAGGAYIPLDPTYPADRLAYIIQDAQARLVLTGQGLLKNLPASIETVYLDQIEAELATQPDHNPASHTQPENLAYLIYTSGSTGQPKGVMISQRSLVSYATTTAERYQVQTSDRFLQFASLNFDTSVEEIYPALLSGATLMLRTEEMLTDLDGFLTRCGELGISILNLPTVYWHELTQSLVAGRATWPASIRLVIIGGEKAYLSDYRAWQSVVPSEVVLLNTYGPTETTVEATICNLNELNGELYDLPIGKPIANTQVYVLDKGLNLVPIGVGGELYVAGTGLARGYLGRPDLSAERFLPNPFSAEPGGRMYRTGDVVRWLDDGQLEFLGRTDQQVKIRGFRIEPDEIITALGQHPTIRQNVVVALDENPLEEVATTAQLPLLLSDTSTKPPIQPVSRSAGQPINLPMALAQQRLWFIEQLNPESPDYNIPAFLRLRGPLNVRTLERVFAELVRRHETLRTGLRLVDSQPRQLIMPSADLAPLELRIEEINEAELEGVAQKAVRQVFDLSNPPLLRLHLWRTGQDEHALLVVIHHLVADRNSLRVLVNELVALYGAFEAEQPSPLADLPFQFADYALWQRDWLQGSHLETALAYWKRQLADAPTVLELPTEQPRSALPEVRQAAQLELNLSAELADRLAQMGQAGSVSLFATLLAAFKVLLYAYSGQSDLVVGTTIPNRSEPGLDQLIGFLVNTLALRTRLEAGWSFWELVEQVEQTIVQAQVAGIVPFEQVLATVNPPRVEGYTPLFQVLCLMQPDLLGGPSRQASQLDITALPLESHVSKYDLTLYFTNEPGGELKANLIYDATLFHSETAERWLSQWRQMLEQALAEPTSSVETLAGLVGSQRRLPATISESAAVENKKSEKRLVAYYVVNNPAQPPEVSELRTFLGQKLPEYMIPSVFVRLESLPAMPNGKLDLKNLPAPVFEQTKNYVAPRDWLEQQLVGIWQDLLSTKPIGIEDNFFELGGHSLLLVQMISRIQVVLGYKLSVAMIYRHATIRLLADELRQQTGQEALSPLVQLQKGQPGQPPFFGVHAVGGSADAYRDLAAQLGPEQPFYALQSLGLFGEQPALTSLKAMAETYVQAIRQVQPHGPYYLIGWSMGGMIAYEIAQQLRAAGEAVAKLVLIDSALHRHGLQYEPAVLSAKLLASYAAHREGIFLSYDELLKYSAQEQLDYVDREVQSGRVQSRLGQDGHLLRYIMNVMITNSQALFEYKVQPYDGEVVLLKANEQLILPEGEDDNPLMADQTYDWEEFCQGGLEVINVPGDHETVMQEPNVVAVAEQVQHLLSQAQARQLNQV